MMRLALDPKTPFEAALEALENWLRNGGTAVIRQFASFEVAPHGPEELLTLLRVAAPERVRQWLQSLGSHWRCQDVLFVHAGVNPHVDLAAFLAAPWNTPLADLDEERHWAWVRWPFLDFDPGSSGYANLFVVHGHTPNDARRNPLHADQISRFRLNLDAGSGMTGLAKMAVFRGDEAKVLTAVGPTNRMLED
jgi:serine/threonine protein phosphatase 1